MDSAVGEQPGQLGGLVGGQGRVGDDHLALDGVGERDAVAVEDVAALGLQRHLDGALRGGHARRTSRGSTPCSWTSRAPKKERTIAMRTNPMRSRSMGAPREAPRLVRVLGTGLPHSGLPLPGWGPVDESTGGATRIDATAPSPVAVLLALLCLVLRVAVATVWPSAGCGGVRGRRVGGHLDDGRRRAPGRPASPAPGAAAGWRSHGWPGCGRRWSCRSRGRGRRVRPG